jgi:hypothetical protein
MNSVTKPVIVVAISLVYLWALPVNAEEVADLSGTWKVNVEQSDFGPMPRPKSTTMRIEHKEPAIKWFMPLIDQNGNESRTESIAAIDGKEYPYKEGPFTHTQVFKRTSSSTIEYIAKSSDGRTIGSGTWTISKDGKVLTQKANTRDMNADPLTVTVVFEKQ